MYIVKEKKTNGTEVQKECLRNAGSLGNNCFVKETLVFENFAAERDHCLSSIFPNFVVRPLEFVIVQVLEQLQIGTPFG